MARHLDQRKAKAEALRKRHPDRIPIICEKLASSDLPEITTKRFLVPANFTVGNFCTVVRNRMRLGPEQAIFIFVNNSLLPMNSLMGAVYQQRHDLDGFVYVVYSGENTFGASTLFVADGVRRMLGGWSVFLSSVAIKLLLLPAKYSTDFDVHRHWLALAGSLPWFKWYTETRPSLWPLDYPPFFAWFEWLLAFLAQLFDPAILHISAAGYTGYRAVVFQKLSVIAADCLLAWALAAYARKLGDGRQPLPFLLVLPGLVIVDHMHFQYNGLLLGMLVACLVAFRTGKPLVGAFLFAILVNLKHIFLYFAPAVAVYLVCGYIFASGGVCAGLGRMVKVAAVAGFVCGTSLGPYLWIGQGELLAKRLFPFGRGLTHAYWAPNFWALYSAADVAVAKGKQPAGCLKVC